MGNCLIAYPNRADVTTLSGGSWTSGLPLDNLKTRKLKQVARTTDATVDRTKFDFTLDVQRKVKVIAFVNHNLSLDGDYRIRGYFDDAYTSLAYDSGVNQVWPAVYTTEQLDWEDANFWTGQILAEDIIGFTWTLSHLLPTAVFAQYWRVEFFDTTNSDGYVQIGRLFIAGEWQPVTNMTYGASLGYEDRTVVEISLGGAEYFDEREPYRVATFSLENMDISEGMSRAFDIQLRLGTKGEVFFIFDTDDTLHSLRRTFLGRLENLGNVEFNLPNRTRSSFKIKELQ
jgi:hypothetical protein